MTLLEALLLFLAGLGAGTINTVVGSGSLITFPTLLALGYPPVLANVTNNVGVLPGSVSGVIAYRRELTGQGGRVARLVSATIIGGTVGALLLLWLPESAFEAIVPVLILLACVLVVTGPRLRAWLSERFDLSGHGGAGTWLVIALTGVYGGYFGAAQGVLLISLLAISFDDDLQRLNACKNVLAGAANGVAAIVFVLVSDVAWAAAGVIAIGSTLGGQVGGTVGRRLPAVVYRSIVVAVGLTAAVVLLAT